MTLLPLTDVRNLLPQEDFTDAQLTTVMALVSGWLRDAAGLTVLPDPVLATDPLYAPALELVALVGENPTSLASKTVGPTSRMWPLAPRRDAILRRVRERYRLQPSGSFPVTVPLPDPPVTPWSVWLRVET